MDAPTNKLRVEGTTPPDEVIADVERITAAAGIEVGGVDYFVDDRDGLCDAYVMHGDVPTVIAGRGPPGPVFTTAAGGRTRSSVLLLACIVRRVDVSDPPWAGSMQLHDRLALSADEMTHPGWHERERSRPSPQQ